VVSAGSLPSQDAQKSDIQSMRGLGTKQGHSAGLDDIFELERAVRLLGTPSARSQDRNIRVWKTPAPCATVRPK